MEIVANGERARGEDEHLRAGKVKAGGQGVVWRCRFNGRLFLPSPHYRCGTSSMFDTIAGLQLRTNRRIRQVRSPWIESSPSLPWMSSQMYVICSVARGFPVSHFYGTPKMVQPSRGFLYTAQQSRCFITQTYTSI